MNQSSPAEPFSKPTPSQQYPKSQNPYAKMSQRRAIACTICAKAKTKCDKAVPSCSRCTAKGLHCEPRSTRRTSDSTYRNPKKHFVSPKRFPTASSIPAMSRHTSPRSVPSSSRHQLVRAMSQMDFHTAVKLGQQQQHQNNFASMPMLTPLQTYGPQIIDECYSYSSSPEQTMSAFSHHADRSNYMPSGRMTPRTPDSFIYNETLLNVDPFDHMMTPQPWSDDGAAPIGLGFENDIPGLLPSESEVRAWTPDFSNSATPMGNVRYESSVCNSPVSLHAWPNASASLSPPAASNTHGVPSLSISECSGTEGGSPNESLDEWSNFQNSKGAITERPSSSMQFYDNIKPIPTSPQIWDDSMLTRSSTF